MQPQRDIKNIVLVGFMGTGKTSVGILLSNMLNMKFIDTDDIIEQDSQESISNIFANKGEECFRDLESKAIEKACLLNRYIISTGGGAVIREQNIQNLRKIGLLFHLDATPEVIFQRTAQQSQRPLLKVADPMNKIRELLKQRAPFYAKADYRIDTSGLTVEEVAKRIFDLYKSFNNKEGRENCIKYM